MESTALAQADSRRSGTSKTWEPQQIAELFAFPGLYDLAPIAEKAMRQPGSKGRRAHYPAAALLAMTAAARATGSLAEACRAAAEVWTRCCDAYRAMTGEELPARAPSRDAVVYFMEKLAATPKTLAEMHTCFINSSVGMARHLGNLTPGEEPNWAAPQESHTIYGDGTIVKPFSDVRQLKDPVTGQLVIVGSRARVSPRVVRSEWLSNVRIDGKTVRGINHVAIHTRTPHGRIVLAVGQAFGAEGVTALDLIDSVAHVAGDGIHTLIYDRAITGWNTEYLMARHGIHTIGKAVARPIKKASDSNDGDRDGDDGHDDIKPEALATPQGQKNAMKRLAAEHGIEYETALAPALRPHVLRRLAEDDKPLPVGTSCYPAKDGWDIVPGKYFWLPPAMHDTPTGPCIHRLAVDDGALYTIDDDPEHGWPIKTGHATCISSTRSGARGRITVTNIWNVPCPAGDFEHTTVWKPSSARYAAKSSGDGHFDMAVVMRELRPLSRADGTRFHDVFGRRNDSESYNNWAKRTLSYKGRAASLRPERQDLDFLAVAILNNSTTWQNSRAN